MVDVGEAISTIAGWSRHEVRVEPLPGGLTNANYLVTRRGERFVLRLTGPNAAPIGIDRAHECRAAATAAALGLGPEVVHFSAEHGVLVTRFVDGRAPTADEMRSPQVMRRVVEALRRVHAIPVSAGDPAYCPFAKAERWRREAGRRGATFPADFDVVARHMSSLRRDHPPVTRPRFCHNDPVRGNILIDRADAIRLIDWEYAGAGDPLFDLAVLSMNNGYDNAQDEALLRAYFRGDVTDNDRRRLRSLKLAFDYHMGVWYVLQTVVSTLDTPFPRGVRWHLGRLRRNLDLPPADPM